MFVGLTTFVGSASHSEIGWGLASKLPYTSHTKSTISRTIACGTWPVWLYFFLATQSAAFFASSRVLKVAACVLKVSARVAVNV